jgi:hypothetical protein
MDTKIGLLVGKLAEASSLLRDSKYDNLAASYEQYARQLALEDIKSKTFQDTLAAIDRSLVGMGSFSDVPLVPQQRAMTKQQARQRQTQLIEEITKAIASFNR